MRKWLQNSANGILLHLQIQPQARRNEVAGVHGDRLKIRIAAPPVDGKANEEVLRFLRKQLNIPLSNLELVRGETSRAKDILCMGITSELIEERLTPNGKDKK
jgi:uncharacterized protein